MPKITQLPNAEIVRSTDFVVIVDNSSLPETKRAFAGLLSGLAPVQTVAGRTGNVALTTADVAALDTTLTSINTTLGTLGTSVTTIDNTVSNIATSVSSISTAVTELQTDVSAIETALTKVVYSDITGISGATVISNVVALTQTEYDAILSPQANTLYVIRSA